MTTIAEFAKSIRGCWSRETSYFPQEWESKNPARGQCLITALLARDVFGGAIIKGTACDEEHYWNLIPNVGEVDFTGEQYGGLALWRRAEAIAHSGCAPDAYPSALADIQHQDFEALDYDDDLSRRFMLLKIRYAFGEALPNTNMRFAKDRWFDTMLAGAEEGRKQSWAV